MIRTLTLVFALLAVPAAAPESSWQRHASPVTDDLHNAFFVDDKQGWILAHQSGAVLHTTDGGASWKVQERLGEGFLESIHFVDARNGWICGDKGRLYRTRNGGESWELRSFGEGLAFYSVRLLDPKRGLLAGLDPAAGKAVLFETSDGGDSWSRRENLPPARGFADAVAFPSASVGYIGGLGTILATGDGGHRFAKSPGRLWIVGKAGTILSRRCGSG